MSNADLIKRAEDWLARLRPSDLGANGPMFTRQLVDALKAAPSAIGAPSYLPGLRLAQEVLSKNGFEKSALAVGVQIRHLLADPSLDKPSAPTDGKADSNG